MQGDGDFRSPECIELLKESDIVCTNPPFSLFRDFIATITEHKKSFLVIGNGNAITYKEIFPLLKEDKMWMGYFPFGSTFWFELPQDTENYEKIIDGKKVYHMPACWFTNLPNRKRNEELRLSRKYNTESFPKYDNYDAIEVGNIVDIPVDYDGVMGVPVSFLSKYNPKQFEILGQTGVIDPEYICIEYKGGRPYINGKRMYSRLLIRKKG